MYMSPAYNIGRSFNNKAQNNYIIVIMVCVWWCVTKWCWLVMYYMLIYLIQLLWI